MSTSTATTDPSTGVSRQLRRCLAALILLTALAVTVLMRSTLAGTIFIVLQAVASMSGLLRIIGQGVNNVLPMIAAKTFLFGYQREPGEPGATAGTMILAGWLAVSALTVMINGTRRAVV